MAEISVAPQSGYQLPSADRAAIIAGSDSAKLSIEIERQRQAFIEKHGSDLPDFGKELVA